MTRLQEIEQRMQEISRELDTASDKELDRLEAEVDRLNEERGKINKEIESRRQLLSGIAQGRTGSPMNLNDPDAPFMRGPGGRTTHDSSVNVRTEDIRNKVVFRSGEKLSDKYPDSDKINLGRCLRAAITRNWNSLNEVEKRAVTPTAAGATMNEVVAAIFIDNLRQNDWLSIFQPTVVNMLEDTVKIPIISALPTAKMHTPGATETTSDPTIGGGTLSAKTLLVTAEAANELLKNSFMAENVITTACVSAVSNLLLQQALYGTGVDPEMKGIKLYTGFADSGSKASEKDLFNLATLANMAIIKKNGILDSMLYDPNLEPRFNKRLTTGELVQPSRAFQKLADAGRVIPHPSVAAGDAFFMQTDQLYLGFRGGMEIEADGSSSFSSYNTKIRVVLRGDIFANVARMCYYSSITTTEPE